MAGISDFKRVVSTVLNNWTGLKTALENGMGGPPSMMRQKLFNLIDTVNDLLAHTKNPSNIDWESIADAMADFLDDQMDIIFEDNSPDEVAVQIVDLYKLFLLPSHVELLNAINEMKYQTPIVSDVLHVNVPVLEDIDDEDEDDESMESEVPTNIEQADGWTIVKRK